MPNNPHFAVFQFFLFIITALRSKITDSQLTKNTKCQNDYLYAFEASHIES